jgi:uncharacterized protein YndB with AHSA1/START domain
MRSEVRVLYRPPTPASRTTCAAKPFVRRYIGAGSFTLRAVADEVSVSREINAPAERVWAMVSDVTRMGEWSPENQGGTWMGGATGPAPGAKFKAENRNGNKKWNTVATVLTADPGRCFSFRVAAAGLKIADWTYTFEPTATGCRVVETWTDQRGRIATTLGKPVSGVADRASHNRAGMEQTLERLAAAAESRAS